VLSANIVKFELHHISSHQFCLRRQNHEKRYNSAGQWWMFLLFVGTSDVEQIGLELSYQKTTL